MNDHQRQNSVDGVEQGIEVDKYFLLYSGLYILLIQHNRKAKDVRRRMELRLNIYLTQG